MILLYNSCEQIAIPNVAEYSNDIALFGGKTMKTNPFFESHVMAARQLPFLFRTALAPEYGAIAVYERRSGCGNRR